MDEYYVDIKDKPFLSVKEAAAYTGIGENKLREIAATSHADISFLVGAKLKFKREALVEYLNHCKII